VVRNRAAWYFHSMDDRSIRFFESEFFIDSPSQSVLVGWTVLVRGVDTPAGPVFPQSGRVLEAEFQGFAGDNSPRAAIQTTVMS
jgi:hypothetical protein